MTTTKRQTAFRIDDDILEGLKAIKEREGIPVSEQVRRALRAWVETDRTDTEAIAAAARVKSRRRAQSRKSK